MLFRSWSANSIVLAAVACALLAYQRKTEVWTAFASALAVVASTIFVVHFCKDERDLWLSTIQIDAAVLGAMSILRLGLHRFLAIETEDLRQLRLLPIQIGVGLAANAVLLFFALLTLVVDPARPGWWLTLHGFWPSW